MVSDEETVEYSGCVKYKKLKDGRVVNMCNGIIVKIAAIDLAGLARTEAL